MSDFLRPNRDEYFLSMASLVSLRATCRRRRVGCVLVDANRHVLATGYNGVARSMPHCLDTPCDGANLPSGTGLDRCNAIHAEQNALLQCRDVEAIETAYITTSPCVTCVKLLMNTGCKRIVFIQCYPDQTAKTLWKGEWIEHGPVINVFAELVVDPALGVSGSDKRQGDLFGLRDKRPALNDQGAGRC